MLSAHNNLSCRCTVGLRCLRKGLIHLCSWKKQRKVSLDDKHKWHTKFPWWIGPFTEINWTDTTESQRTGKLFSYRWKPSQSYSTYKQTGLFVLHIRLVKMCWQTLFIPLNRSSFFFSELKCLLINLSQKQEQMQLFKWINSISFFYYMSEACVEI